MIVTAVVIVTVLVLWLVSLSRGSSSVFPEEPIVVSEDNNNQPTSQGSSIPVSDSQQVRDPAQLCPDGNHPHIIDLGLPSGTKWACCNVGANKPEGYGDMFAWGETTTKSSYDWNSYRWCNGAYDKQTKYNNNSSYGTVDNKTQLELDDDAAARANWHGSWRMPTIAECQELKDNCSYEWTTVNGVKGGKFTSRSNGRSIFLPAAGWRYGTSLSSRGEYGDYWSSSLDESSPYNARSLYFGSGGANASDRDHRDYGRSVRPVLRN